MDKFERGEIAVYAGCVCHPTPAWNGREVEIVGAYDKVGCNGCGIPKIASGYLIKFSNSHKIFTALPEELRKRKPPRDDLEKLSWDDPFCVWRPREKVTGSLEHTFVPLLAERFPR